MHHTFVHRSHVYWDRYMHHTCMHQESGSRIMDTCIMDTNNHGYMYHGYMHHGRKGAKGAKDEVKEARRAADKKLGPRWPPKLLVHIYNRHICYCLSNVKQFE